MKVLVVESAGGLWGSERALLDLIASAPKVEFAVCCPPHTPLANELARRKVRVFPWFIERLHEKSRLDRLRAAWGVWRACMKYGPDLIHLNQSGAYRVVQLPARMLELPIMCHVRIFEDVAYLAACKPDRADLRGMIAISRSIEDEIRSFPKLASIPVHRVYDAYARSQPGAAERRGKRVACVGRVTPIKGQEVLLSALSHVDIECLIVGDGPVDYVRQLKARSHAHWIGFVEDVASLLHSCRGLVLQLRI